MYICICHAVTEDTIVSTICRQRCRSVADIQKELDICNTCTGCKEQIVDLLEECGNEEKTDI